MTTTWTVGRVLRDRTARLCLTTVVVSGFGTTALWLASGVWVKDLTGSNGLAALCLLAMWAPALAGPALGTLADRVPRKPLLIACDLLLAALLPTLLWVDSAAGVWLVLAVLLVYGAVGAVHDAAESALVATAVAPELLGDVNGLRMTATEGTKLLAPLAGAGLYTVYGGPAVNRCSSPATCSWPPSCPPCCGWTPRPACGWSSRCSWSTAPSAPSTTRPSRRWSPPPSPRSCSATSTGCG